MTTPTDSEERAQDERAPFEPSAIRAVAFDAYGTLFDWDFRVALAEFLAASGITTELEAAAKMFASEAFTAVSVWAPGHRDAEGKLDRALMLDGPLPEWTSTWEMWRQQFEYTFEKLEVSGDATAGANHLRDVLSRAPAYPEAFETIERLAARGYLLGLMSNADEDFLQGAVSFNRLRFSVIQSSESLRVYKPHRAAFAGLCARLGYAPDEVLYVGDSAPTDVRGALHAGLRAVWIRRPEERAAQETRDAEAKAKREAAIAAGEEVAPEAPRDDPTPDLEVETLITIAEHLGA